jgi:DNA ligase-1
VPTTLLLFSQANDAAAATPSKLQKQSILADYFRALTDETDLRLAVRYTGGRPFAASDERVLNVGWSAVSDVIPSMLRLDPGDFHERVVKSGEMGEALASSWPTSNFADSEAIPGSGTGVPPVQGTPERTNSHPSTGLSMKIDPHGRDARAIGESLTLTAISTAFDDLAAGGGSKRKREVLRNLFSRCTHPREAAYLAKIIFREMRSGVREGVLQAAIAQAFEKPLAAVQRCQLLVGDLDEVAALARNNALDVARLRLFHPIQFMLATPVETAELAAQAMGGRAFWSEDKLDGIRAQVHKSADRIAIYTRTMDRTDESFPDVVSQIAKLPGEFLLDGEIVPYRDGQVLPFAHIQRRLGRKVLTPKILRDNPATFIAFDILYRDGQLLMDCPLKLRRESLDSLESLSSLRTTDRQPVSAAGQITAAFDAARARRNEGIVLKDPESAYSPGRRGQWWLKLKTHLPTFDCVVTAAEYGHGKRRHVLSDYTFAVWDRDPTLSDATLVNIGKAFSGLTDIEIAELTQLFLSLATAQHGRVFAVRPRVVLEIACDQIQKSNRHASGYALRFPRIKRIRTDKRPEDADLLRRIVELYESGHNFGRMTEPITSAEPTLFD